MKSKRINEIIDYVRSRGVTSYEELCNQFNVSLSTMRRDIDILEEDGKIQKVYGGVKLTEKTLEENEDLLLFDFDFNKDRIAKQAASLVNDGDIILMTSGSTLAHMVKYLKDKKDITLISNNLAVLNEAFKCSFNVVSLGGTMDRKAMSFVGFWPSKQIENLNANKCFISCNGINLHSISNVVDSEADIKRAVINISNEIILLADNSKFDKMSLYSFASIDDLDYLITDKQPSDEYINKCKEEDCKLIIAK